VTGDFNSSGSDVREYAEIRRTADALDLHDLWAWDVYGHAPSEGHTCRLTDGPPAGWQRDFAGPASGVLAGGVCHPVDQPGLQGRWRVHCSDDVLHVTPPRGVGRYDDVFVARPTPEQRLRLEAARPLRRPFPLFPDDPQGSLDGERFLSDHLGLDLTLFCSPRD
jgi:hypothetical protein